MRAPVGAEPLGPPNQRLLLAAPLAPEPLISERSPWRRPKGLPAVAAEAHCVRLSPTRLWAAGRERTERICYCTARASEVPCHVAARTLVRLDLPNCYTRPVTAVGEKASARISRFPISHQEAAVVSTSAPVTYKAVQVNPNQLSARGNTTQALQEMLNTYGAEGWQLVAVEPQTGHLIFRQ